MRVTLQLFAQLRERAGTPRLTLELPDDARVGDALDRVECLAGGLPLVLAVNRRYAERGDPLSPGDELALVPPVSGGGGVVHVAVSERPLSLDGLVAAVADPRAGAVVSFLGVTRAVARLEYEAYAEMARERMAAIAAAALGEHGLCAAAVEHRVGPVALSEPSVAVVVSAPHRDEAFAGARAIIDAVKAQTPIWKREVDQEGEARWVTGRPPA